MQTVCLVCEPNRRAQPGEAITHGLCPLHFFAKVFEYGLEKEHAAREQMFAASIRFMQRMESGCEHCHCIAPRHAPDCVIVLALEKLGI